MQRPMIRHATAVLRRQSRKRGLARPLGRWQGNLGRGFAQLATTTKKTESPETGTAPSSVIAAAAGPSSTVPSPPAVKAQGEDPITRYDSLVAEGVLRDDPHQRGIIERLQALHGTLVRYVPAEVPASSRSTSWVRLGAFYSHSFVWLILRRQFSSLNPFAGTRPSAKPRGVPRGIYLHGTVGTGKTMLMDLFYDTLPPHLHPHRRRVHFHAFMVDVFRRVHAIKHGLPRDGSGVAGKERKVKEWDPMQGKSDERAVGVERLTGGGLFEGLTERWGKKGMDEEDAIYEAARELAEEGRILCFDEVRFPTRSNS